MIFLSCGWLLSGILDKRIYLENIKLKSFKYQENGENFVCFTRYLLLTFKKKTSEDIY